MEDEEVRACRRGGREIVPLAWGSLSFIDVRVPWSLSCVVTTLGFNLEARGLLLPNTAGKE